MLVLRVAVVGRGVGTMRTVWTSPTDEMVSPVMTVVMVPPTLLTRMLVPVDIRTPVMRTPQLPSVSLVNFAVVRVVVAVMVWTP